MTMDPLSQRITAATVLPRGKMRSSTTRKETTMRKLIISTWLVALTLATGVFAQGVGSYADVQTRNGTVSLATNIAVVTTPTLVAKANGGANVRMLVNTGTSAVSLLFSQATTASSTITNQFSGSLGTFTLGAGATNTLHRGAPIGLWTGYIYGQSASGTTNNVVVIELKP